MEDKIKKGYKASHNGWCKDMKYEVGKTYTMNEKPVMCRCGFHYCEIIDDTLTYYPYKNGVTKIFEIEDLGKTITKGGKSVTNKIKIVREIPVSEYNDLFKRYVFDAEGNLIQFKHTNGELETYSYDANGTKTRWESLNGYWVNWTYDTKGNMTRREDSRGIWTTCEFNADGKKTRRENSDGDWEAWEYDVNGNKTRYENVTGYWDTTEYDDDGIAFNYKSGQNKVLTNL